MSGINQGVIFDVCRLKAEFADEIGNLKAISGTGFWLTNSDDKIFVTNKHNVNPTVCFGKDTKLTLYSLEIELRKFDASNPYPDTQYFSIDIENSILEDSLEADAAILLNPKYLTEPREFRSGGVLSVDHIANKTFFNTKISLMDTASFIGFAGNKVSKWWDQEWNLGVARTVNIASVPTIPFTHPDVKTSDVTLVAGLSFSGSSGSVVISHQKGIEGGPGLYNPNYVPPKIIGVMSGHWSDKSKESDMFSHSGLSYFTRSTAILSLISIAKTKRA